MNLQLELPHAEGPAARNADDSESCCRGLDFSAFEPRTLEILQTLNQMFDQMSLPAAH